MANNPKKPGTNAGNTFTQAEIEGMVQLCNLLQRGGDARVMIRQPAIQSTFRKFQKMNAKLSRVRRELAQESDRNPHA